MDRANYREVPYDYTQDEIKIKSEDGLEGNELDQLNANIKKLPESGDEVESDFKDPDATMFSLPDDSPRDEMMTDKMSFVVVCSWRLVAGWLEDAGYDDVCVCVSCCSCWL